MKYRYVKFCIFIFSCIHLVQCNYLHRRNDDTDNNVQGKPPVLSEVDKDGPLLLSVDKGKKDTMTIDGESSAPDAKDKDGELSAPDIKGKDGQTIENPSVEILDDGESDVADDDKNGLNGDDDESGNQDEVLDGVVVQSNGANVGEKTSNCWFPIEAHAHFIEMDKLDEKFSKVRRKQRAASSKAFDSKMLNAMLKTRAIAERALQNFGGDPNLIPAGLNLGGSCMMRMPQSVLFFHRMKLRNNTHFRVNYLRNDLSDMFVTLRFFLNDLHLLGDYERAITYNSPSTLYYTPTYGELEFLLRDVEYKVEGRYRLLNDRLYVEHIISDLSPRAILMRYMKENNTASMTSIKLDYLNISPYLQRMQNDLDHWLKDYFNDFLIYFDLPNPIVNSQMQAYENKKTIVRNRFADSVIKAVRKRLRHVNASSIVIPNFKIYTVSEMEITLYDGVIRGLDTIHRRSVATGKLDSKNVRHLDTIVGFSSLKVEYKYNMFLRTGLPPLFGMLVLDANELTGRLALKTVRDSPTLDMHFFIMEPSDKARSLVVEGPANRYIAKYKNILEHQISSIMSSTMVHHMQQLDSLVRCQTHLIGKDDPKYKTIDESDSIESTNDQKQYENVDPADQMMQTDDGGDVTNSEPEPVTDATDDATKLGPEEPAEPKLPEDYIVSKKESIELEFPSKDGDEKGEKMKLEVNEKFSLTRLKKGQRRTG